MASDKTYQGWANHETWAVNLEIGNDRGSYDYWNEAAREARDVDPESDEAAALALADRLKDEFEEADPCAERGDLWATLMAAALSEVDWLQIAKGLLESAAGSDREGES